MFEEQRILTERADIKDPMNLRSIDIINEISQFSPYNRNSILSLVSPDPLFLQMISEQNEFFKAEKAKGEADKIPAMIEAIANNSRTYPVIDKLYHNQEKECYQAITVSIYKDAYFLTTKNHIKDEYAKKALGVLSHYMNFQPEALKEIFQTGWKKMSKQIANNPDYSIVDAIEEADNLNIDYTFADEYGFDAFGPLGFFAGQPNYFSEEELVKINAMARAKIEHEGRPIKYRQDSFREHVIDKAKDIIMSTKNDILKDCGYLDYSKLPYKNSDYDYGSNYVFSACRTLLNYLGLGIRSITDYEVSRKEVEEIIGSIIGGKCSNCDVENDELEVTPGGSLIIDSNDYFFLLVIKILAQEYIAAKKAYTEKAFAKDAEAYQKSNEENEKLIREKEAVELKLGAVIKKQEDTIDDMIKETAKLRADYNKAKKQLEEANLKILRLEQELDEVKDEEDEVINEYVEETKKVDLREEFKDLSEKNIVVIGGRETWQSKIRNLFPNWSVFDKMDLNFDPDLLYTRDVVVNTSVLNHAIYYKIINGMPEGKKPVILNNNNVELCLKKIRECLVKK